MFCTNCGKDNPDTNKFCLQCGKPLAGETGEIGPPPVAPPPVSEAASPAAPPRSSNRLPLILGGALLVVALAAAAWFLLPRLLGGGGGSDILVAVPNRTGEEYDLAVLRLGDELNEATTIAEGVQEVNIADSYAVIGERSTGDDAAARLIGGNFGGFLPGTDRLVAYFAEDGETRLMEYVAGAEEPVEMMSEQSGTFVGIYSTDIGDLFIYDYTGSSPFECYLAVPGEEADRVARGDSCQQTADGRGVISTDSNSAGEMTVTVTDLASGDETTLLDDMALWSLAQVSADGSHVAYRPIEDDGNPVVAADAAGEIIFTSDEYDEIRTIQFAGLSDTIYFIAREDDMLGLYTTTGGDPLLEDPALAALAIPDGETVAVVTADGDGAGEVSVVNLAVGAVTEVYAGDNLQITRTADPDRLLIKEEVDGDLVLTAAELSGANPVTLFDESDYTFQMAFQPLGDTRLYMVLSNQDGRSLFVAPLDGSPGYFALEEWSGFVLLNASGDTLVFRGSEDSGDDEILYALPLVADADPIELDDDAEGGYGYAVFAPDGRSVIYNATVGENADDVVVRQVRLDGEEPPEDLYDEVYLAAAGWAEIDPFRMTSDLGDNSLQWTSAGQLAQPAETTGGEGEIVGVETERATELRPLAFGSSGSGAITQNSTYSMGSESGYGVVYFFNGRSGDTVQIDVFGAGTITSNLDPFVMLLDEDNTVLATDDDGGDDNTDSLLTYTLRSDGEYYVIVRSFDGSYGVGNEMAYQVWLNYD